MGQAFLFGQSGGGDIDFANMQHEVVYRGWRRGKTTIDGESGLGVVEIPGPGLYSITFFQTTTNTVYLYFKAGDDGKPTGRTDSINRSTYQNSGDAVITISSTILDIKTNSSGTYDVYTWHSTTGAYTLIESDVSVFFFSNSYNTNIYLIIKRIIPPS